MLELKYRLARLEDANTLLSWRNDPKTRLASHEKRTVQTKEHHEWLGKILKNPNRQLYIFEQDSLPVGTARYDSTDHSSGELSWTVSPTSRGQGVGTAMVQLMIQKYPGKIIALIKNDNIASKKIAESAGLVFISNKGELNTFSNV